MSAGRDLSPQQVKDALAYNQTRFSIGFLGIVRSALGLPIIPPFDAAGIRAVADWQEANVGVGSGDGKIGPRTEAFLNLTHPRALGAVTAARRLQRQGNILFDSWHNDYRDNNNDGIVDGPKERASDGAHMAGTYPSFGVQQGTYSGQGWDFLRPGPPVVVTQTRTIKGPFQYRVCADLVSAAYKAAGVMGAQRSTLFIHEEFKKKGYIFQRSSGYPSEYLPGDFIHTLGGASGAEGHSGIVMQREPTNGGGNLPMVFQLPGPSTQLSDGTYDPTSTNDVTIERWSAFRTTKLNASVQYLGRLLHSKLG